MKSKLPLILGACGATLVGALLLQAQSGPTPATAPATPAPKHGAPGDKVGFLRGRAAEKLGLTSEQQAKLDAVREKHRGEVGAILQDKSLTEEQRREKIRAAVKAGFEEAKTVLTPEQQEKAKKFMQHARQNRGPKHGGYAQRPGFKGPAHGARPGLHTARHAPGPMMQQAPGMMRAEIAQRLDLSAEQRKQLSDLRFQLEEKELAHLKDVKALREQMKSVLTPEQQKKVEHFRHQRGPQHGRWGGPGFGPGGPRGARIGLDDATEDEDFSPAALDDDFQDEPVDESAQ